MPIPLNVQCAECGNDLNITARSMESLSEVLCEVEPCKTCMVDAHQAGYRENEEED